MKEWKNERIKEWKNKRMKEWKNKRMKECKKHIMIIPSIYTIRISPLDLWIVNYLMIILLTILIFVHYVLDLSLGSLRFKDPKGIF